MALFSPFIHYSAILASSFFLFFVHSEGRRIDPAPAASVERSSFLFGLEENSLKRFSSLPRFRSISSLSPETETGGSEAANTPQDNTAEATVEPPPPVYFYPLDDYLVLPNSRRYCEGSNILLASAAKDSSFTNASEGRAACSSDKSCSFVSSGPSKRLSPPLPLTFADGLLPGTGANWFCTGEEWCRSTKAAGWLTLVKGDEIRAASLAFDVHLNTFIGGCEGPDVVKEIARINGLSAIENALKICENEAECGFLIINFAAEDDAPNRVRQPKALLCRGVANEWKKENGVVAFTQKNMSAVIEGELTKLKPKKSKGGREGSGSITQDNLFDSVPKGTLVPAKLKDLI